MTDPERKAWNAAIKAAAELAQEDGEQWPRRASDYAQGSWDMSDRISRRIRSLTKEADE